MTPMGRWIYAIACVLVPVAWGLIVVWASNRLEGVLSRHSASGGDPSSKPPQPPLEYHI